MTRPQSLLSTIRALGGINIREIRDLSGEGRTGRAGIQVGLFRRPAFGTSGLKISGFGLDELIPRLTDQGFYIPEDDIDGGVQALRDMIRDEVSGAKTYSYEDAETVWERELEAARTLQAETYPALPRFLVQAAPIPNRYLVHDAHAGRDCPTIAAGMTRAVAELYAERMSAREELRA